MAEEMDGSKKIFQNNCKILISCSFIKQRRVHLYHKGSVLSPIYEDGHFFPTLSSFLSVFEPIQCKLLVCPPHVSYSSVS